jgi:hypothetical protein
MGLLLRVVIILLLALLIEYHGGGEKLLCFYNSFNQQALRYKRAPVESSNRGSLMQKSDSMHRKLVEDGWECPFDPINMLVTPTCISKGCQVPEGWTVVAGEPTVLKNVIVMGPSTRIKSRPIVIPAMRPENGNKDACYTLSFVALLNGTSSEESAGSYKLYGKFPVPFSLDDGMFQVSLL